MNLKKTILIGLAALVLGTTIPQCTDKKDSKILFNYCYTNEALNNKKKQIEEDKDSIELKINSIELCKEIIENECIEKSSEFSYNKNDKIYLLFKATITPKDITGNVINGQYTLSTKSYDRDFEEEYENECCAQKKIIEKSIISPFTYFKRSEKESNEIIIKERLPIEKLDQLGKYKLIIKLNNNNKKLEKEFDYRGLKINSIHEYSDFLKKKKDVLESTSISEVILQSYTGKDHCLDILINKNCFNNPDLKQKREAYLIKKDTINNSLEILTESYIMPICTFEINLNNGMYSIKKRRKNNNLISLNVL